MTVENSNSRFFSSTLLLSQIPLATYHILVICTNFEDITKTAFRTMFMTPTKMQRETARMTTNWSNGNLQSRKGWSSRASQDIENFHATVVYRLKPVHAYCFDHVVPPTGQYINWNLSDIWSFSVIFSEWLGSCREIPIKRREKKPDRTNISFSNEPNWRY